MSHGGSPGAGPRDTGGIWINTRSRGRLSQPPPARLKTARVFAGGISQSSRSAWTWIWRTEGGSCAVRSRTPGRRFGQAPGSASSGCGMLLFQAPRRLERELRPFFFARWNRNPRQGAPCRPVCRFVNRDGISTRRHTAAPCWGRVWKTDGGR